jgi:hypothetical protein
MLMNVVFSWGETSAPAWAVDVIGSSHEQSSPWAAAPTFEEHVEQSWADAVLDLSHADEDHERPSPWATSLDERVGQSWTADVLELSHAGENHERPSPWAAALTFDERVETGIVRGAHPILPRDTPRELLERLAFSGSLTVWGGRSGFLIDVAPGIFISPCAHVHSVHDASLLISPGAMSA